MGYIVLWVLFCHTSDLIFQDFIFTLENDLFGEYIVGPSANTRGNVIDKDYTSHRQLRSNDVHHRQLRSTDMHGKVRRDSPTSAKMLGVTGIKACGNSCR